MAKHEKQAHTKIEKENKIHSLEDDKEKIDENIKKVEKIPIKQKSVYEKVQFKFCFYLDDISGSNVQQLPGNCWYF